MLVAALFHKRGCSLICVVYLQCQDTLIIRPLLLCPCLTIQLALAKHKEN